MREEKNEESPAAAEAEASENRESADSFVCSSLSDQYVIPGNIIYTQRGTLWWPGENCIMGRDHTIHAAATGYVKYYRDPARHPDRRYIGVVFDRADTLPYPRHAERKRRLNMEPVPIKTPEPEPAVSPSGIPTVIEREFGDVRINGLKQPNMLLRLRKDYSYREDNWRIGRLVDVSAAGLRAGKRSRRAGLRRRRWLRERMIAGEKKAAERRRVLAEETDAEGGGSANKGRQQAAATASKGKAKAKDKKRVRTAKKA
jgi:ribosomal protein L27